MVLIHEEEGSGEVTQGFGTLNTGSSGNWNLNMGEIELAMQLWFYAGIMVACG